MLASICNNRRSVYQFLHSSIANNASPPFLLVRYADSFVPPKFSSSTSFLDSTWLLNPEYRMPFSLPIFLLDTVSRAHFLVSRLLIGSIWFESTRAVADWSSFQIVRPPSLLIGQTQRPKSARLVTMFLLGCRSHLLASKRRNTTFVESFYINLYRAAVLPRCRFKLSCLYYVYLSD